MLKLKLIVSAALLLISSAAFAVTSCGNVTITHMLINKSYGSLIRVSNEQCGKQGWVCLDPNAEYLTKVLSDRLYAYALTAYTTGATVGVSTAGNNDVYVEGCGAHVNAWPVIYDLRSVN